jgi:hypothetical protein
MKTTYAALLLAACAASCGPGEPKRLPPASKYGGAGAPAEETAAALKDSPVVTVTHADESPFPGCKVSAFEPTSHERAAGGTSDGKGVVQLDRLDTKRRYELFVEPPLDQADSYEPSRTHAWPPSDTTVRLAALLTVEGRVTASDGSPAKGVAVRCSHANGAVSVAVGDDGSFVFRRVPEGAVQLAVAASFVDAERGRCGPSVPAKAGDRDVVLTSP